MNQDYVETTAAATLQRFVEHVIAGTPEEFAAAVQLICNELNDMLVSVRLNRLHASALWTRMVHRLTTHQAFGLTKVMYPGYTTGEPAKARTGPECPSAAADRRAEVMEKLAADPKQRCPACGGKVDGYGCLALACRLFPTKPAEAEINGRKVAELEDELRRLRRRAEDGLHDAMAKAGVTTDRLIAQVDPGRPIEPLSGVQVTDDVEAAQKATDALVEQALVPPAPPEIPEGGTPAPDQAPPAPACQGCQPPGNRPRYVCQETATHSVSGRGFKTLHCSPCAKAAVRFHAARGEDSTRALLNPRCPDCSCPTTRTTLDGHPTLCEPCFTHRYQGEPPPLPTGHSRNQEPPTDQG